jgi:hypothetical protein
MRGLQRQWDRLCPTFDCRKRLASRTTTDCYGRGQGRPPVAALHKARSQLTSAPKAVWWLVGRAVHAGRAVGGPRTASVLQAGIPRESCAPVPPPVSPLSGSARGSRDRRLGKRWPPARPLKHSRHSWNEEIHDGNLSFVALFLSLFPFLSLPFFHPLYLSIYLSIYQSIYPSFFLSLVCFVYMCVLFVVRCVSFSLVCTVSSVLLLC